MSYLYGIYILLYLPIVNTGLEVIFPVWHHHPKVFCKVTPVNSMWITGTITAKQKVRPLRSLQVDFSLTRNVSYAVR